MIKSRIRIEDGPIEDFFTKFGFIYLEADKRTAPPEKDCDTTSYAGQAGENIDPRTVYAPFDYTAKFIVEAPNKDLDNVNIRIASFNSAIRETDPSSAIIRKKQVSFYDDYNRVKIVGYPELIAEPEEIYHSHTHGALDFAVIELKIHVSSPSLCDFNTLPGQPEIGDMPVTLQLSTNGTDLFMHTSQPIGTGYAAFLTRGSVRNRVRYKKTSIGEYFYTKQKGHYRWHVGKSRNSIVLDSVTNQILGYRIARYILNHDGMNAFRWYPTASVRYGYGYLKIRKSRTSHTLLPCRAGRTAKITYGIAIYNREGKRISNVAYFTSNLRVLKTAPYNEHTSNPSLYFTQWFAV